MTFPYITVKTRKKSIHKEVQRETNNLSPQSNTAMSIIWYLHHPCTLPNVNLVALHPAALCRGMVLLWCSGLGCFISYNFGTLPGLQRWKRPTRTRTHTHDTCCKALLLAINPLPQGGKRKNLHTRWFCKGMLVSPSSLTTLYKLESFSMTVYSASLSDELHCAFTAMNLVC